MFIKPFRKQNFIAVCIFLFSLHQGFSQQQADTTFITSLESPNFNSEKAPAVYIDGMHNNLHQLHTGFSPFAKLAEADGYKVNAFNSFDQLKDVDILVIANAINANNQGNWKRPIYNAFDEAEVKNINEWVKNGGSILLIADHMPFAGAASNLAESFGFEYCDGFAQLAKEQNRNDVFSKSNKRLTDSPVTNGTYGNEIDEIASFTGSSFKIPKKAIPVMKFRSGDKCLQPEVAWQFNDSTLTTDLSGSYQGALMDYGKGKIAIFGEAAMYTAQTIEQNGNTFKVGFNSPAAPNNVQFIRNVLLWLADEKESERQKSNTEAEIFKVNREMELAFNNKNYEAIADFYSRDAVMLGNNTEVIGRENLREYWGRFEGGDTWELSNIEIKELGGDYALQRGISVITWKNSEGEISESKVIFSLVWRKTEEGWKIMLDHYSPR